MIFITSLKVSAQGELSNSATPLKFRLPRLTSMIDKWSLPRLI